MKIVITMSAFVGPLVILGIVLVVLQSKGIIS